MPQTRQPLRWAVSSRAVEPFQLKSAPSMSHAWPAPPAWYKNQQRPPHQPAAPEAWSEGRHSCNRLWFDGCLVVLCGDNRNNFAGQQMRNPSPKAGVLGGCSVWSQLIKKGANRAQQQTHSAPIGFGCASYQSDSPGYVAPIADAVERWHSAKSRRGIKGKYRPLRQPDRRTKMALCHYFTILMLVSC